MKRLLGFYGVHSDDWRGCGPRFLVEGLGFRVWGLRFRMNVLVTLRNQKWTILWLGHGCTGDTKGLGHLGAAQRSIGFRVYGLGCMGAHTQYYAMHAARTSSVP